MLVKAVFNKKLNELKYEDKYVIEIINKLNDILSFVQYLQLSDKELKTLVERGIIDLDTLKKIELVTDSSFTKLYKLTIKSVSSLANPFIAN